MGLKTTKIVNQTDYDISYVNGIKQLLPPGRQVEVEDISMPVIYDDCDERVILSRTGTFNSGGLSFVVDTEAGTIIINETALHAVVQDNSRMYLQVVNRTTVGVTINLPGNQEVVPPHSFRSFTNAKEVITAEGTKLGYLNPTTIGHVIYDDYLFDISQHDPTTIRITVMPAVGG